MLFGEFKHQLDAKNRLRMPAKMRTTLGADYVITKDFQEECLFVFPAESLANLKKKTDEVSLLDAKAQNQLRVIFSSGYKVEEDPQGRFVLPPTLKRYAGIVKNVVIIGVCDRAEIWAEEKWNEINSGDNKEEQLEALKQYKI